MAIDSSGVVTSQVARRGRVVVSPPILFFVSRRRRLLSAFSLAVTGWSPRSMLSLQTLLQPAVYCVVEQ